jgi:hypothetical protein
MPLENKLIKAKANTDFSIQVCNSFDGEEDFGDFNEETFQKDEILEFDVLCVNRNDTLEVQFGDGSVCFNLPLIYLDIISAE